MSLNGGSLTEELVVVRSRAVQPALNEVAGDGRSDAGPLGSAQDRLTGKHGWFNWYSEESQ